MGRTVLSAAVLFFRFPLSVPGKSKGKISSPRDAQECDSVRALQFVAFHSFCRAERKSGLPLERRN